MATSTSSRVDVAFTDSSIDLRGLHDGFADHLASLEAAVGLPFARLHQVHGDAVHVVTEIPDKGPREDQRWPVADAMVTDLRGVALMVRVADCVPILLADPVAGVIGTVHAGRAGIALDVATSAVEAMRALGADGLTAWIGPHVCGSCYEVPESMRDEIAALVPQTRAESRWGTPSLDLAAGVHAQLESSGVRVVDVGRCTMEDPSLHSYRREGQDAGRLAGLVWLS